MPTDDQRRKLDTYWSRPRSTSVLDALRQNAPWAIRRLQQAARRPKVTPADDIAPWTFRATVAGAPPPIQEEVTAMESVAIDILVDAVIDEWLAQNPSWSRRSR